MEAVLPRQRLCYVQGNALNKSQVLYRRMALGARNQAPRHVPLTCFGGDGVQDPDGVQAPSLCLQLPILLTVGTRASPPWPEPLKGQTDKVVMDVAVSLGP